ncbi:cadherin-1 [Misgurnus anguillicaudatus]|uniref:cadherin-1 n=1 Tax=Misgurnus anguillicaudatus TaxID=75329 RepID=UPI003CCFCBF0
MIIVQLGVIIFLCQVLSCGFAEELPCTPGFDSESFVFKVRSDHLESGKRLGKIIFNACDGRSRSVFQSGNKRFAVRTDGSVRTKALVTLNEGQIKFNVHAWDSSGMKHTTSVRVECTAHHHTNTAVDVTQQIESSDDVVMEFPRSSAGLKRAKRGWVIPPLRESENTNGLFPQFLAQIRSDYAAETKVTYSITGEGADQPPVGLFICDKLTGSVYVTQPLDREKKASYKLIAHAVGEGGLKEKPMEIIIDVIDQNDNKPQFTQNPFNGNVPDAAPKDYEFMTVTATDADDPETDNAEIRYKIISQDPPSPNPNMFDINPVTGGIRVNSEGLNREKWSNYTLVIEAADMKGEGFKTIGRAVITVTDSNDNPPQFKQTEYTVSVPENQVGVEVANLTVTDGDEPGSPAWSTKYKIISGDEGGVFSVSTGPSQLEGIITTVKPLDFEVTKQFILSVIVENDHPFAGSLPTSTATVTKSETLQLHKKKMIIMRLGVIFLCQVFLCGLVELSSGFDPVVKVRSDRLPREKRLGRVTLNDGRSRAVFQSVDKRVRVECTAHHHEDHHMNTEVNITPQMKSFPDDLVVRFPRSSAGLKRVKRGWIIPPLQETENKRGPFPQFLAHIKSDYARETTLTYSITGEGADLPPVGLFTCDRRTGALYVTQPLDREKKASYKLITHAVGEGGLKERPMKIFIRVIDQNDNRPQFTQNSFNGNVPEAAPVDYEFMTVTATDADDPETDNAEVRYKIISQDPPSPNPDMFAINAVTGGIRVIGSGLDREKWPKYTLVIQAADMKGNGYTTSGKAVIIVTDSNDNPPQFEQETYTVSVPENQVGVEVAKLTVTDDDEPGSPAWSTKYKIISGDKLGVFNISTGPSQLEGIITTVKPLDYEKTKQYILSVIVENDDPFVGSLPTSTATVTVNVEDVNEPPVFNPKEKHIIKPEDVSYGSDLVAFTATDPDTERSQKLTYRIGSDPAGFLSVVEDTGMIKVKSLMDRESNKVIDGKYKAIILAVDNDEPARATGTGTLIIELEDVNDNAPYINEREIKICNQEAPPVLLSITDKDLHPNAGPFSVETQGDTMKNWTARMNDSATGIELMLKSTLEPGVYNVVLRVFDKQKLNQDSTIKATVCDCKGESVVCNETRAHGLLLSVVIKIICTIFGLLSISYLLVLFMRRQICFGQSIV